MRKLFIAMVLVLFAVSFISALNVNIIMKNAKAYKGAVLGRTADQLYIMDEDSNTVTLAISDIGSVYDTDHGTKVDLSTISSSGDRASSSAASIAQSPAADTNAGQPDTNSFVISESSAAATANAIADEGDNSASNGESQNVAIQTDNLISPQDQATPDQTADPDIAVIPNSSVYYSNYDGYDCYFNNGYWYRPWNGGWYRSYAYNGGWSYVNYNYIPYGVTHLPNGWRNNIGYAPVVRWGAVRSNWRVWQANRYWANRGWRPQPGQSAYRPYRSAQYINRYNAYRNNRNNRNYNGINNYNNNRNNNYNNNNNNNGRGRNYNR